MPVINLKSSGNGTRSRKPLEAGTWDAVVVEVNHGESKVKGTPFVEFVYKVSDPDAVRTDGEKFTGKVWDQYYLTEAATWRLKKVASAVGAELPSDDDEVELSDLAEDLAEQLVGTEVRLTTRLRDDERGNTFDDGTTKQYVDVESVEA